MTTSHVADGTNTRLCQAQKRTSAGRTGHNMCTAHARKRAYRDGVGGADIASVGNVCDEVTPLSQRLKGTTCSIAILTHLQPHNNVGVLGMQCNLIMQTWVSLLWYQYINNLSVQVLPL